MSKPFLCPPSLEEISEFCIRTRTPHRMCLSNLLVLSSSRRFYLVFEKVEGGQLFNRIQERELFTEREASQIIRDLASALRYLHSKGKYEWPSVVGAGESFFLRWWFTVHDADDSRSPDAFVL